MRRRGRKGVQAREMRGVGRQLLACASHAGFAAGAVREAGGGPQAFRTAAESRAVKPHRLMKAVGTPCTRCGRCARKAVQRVGAWRKRRVWAMEDRKSTRLNSSHL